MEITHLGHACFRLRAKNTALVIDPFSSKMTGLRMSKVTADAVLCTHGHLDHHDLERVEGYRVVIDAPGEYEVGGAQILGIAAFHITLYQIKLEGLTLAHLGDLGQTLTDKMVEELDGVDILMIPTGGVNTIGPAEAAQVVAQLEPKIVIPMHYPVDLFLKEMGKEGVKPQPKLVITKDKLPEEMEVIVLEI